MSIFGLRSGICALLFLIGLNGISRADDAVKFSAQAERLEISQDETVAIKMTVQMEGGGRIGSPQFNAPDFDIVNEYSGSFTQSFYENGKFGVRNSRTFTVVLRPKRTGVLAISDLKVEVEGKSYDAPQIQVRVSAGGGGTPPPRGYGGGGVGLRGSGKRPSGSKFFIRAELDKDQAYKGEQVIVSYYLYRRVRVFNIQVDKYPVLNGFLREDLEMPVLGQRLDSEPVVLDGAPYERSLLVRYAAYPLKAGELKIDSMAIKANYYDDRAGRDDEEEVENDPFMNFFQQMTPRIGSHKSELISLKVIPLPEDGRPATFTGGVGDFSVSAAASRYEAKAGEAISLTVKVEGRGNVSSIEEPKIDWPAGVELYESKGRTKQGVGGVGEKIFEYLLIPREPGTLSLSGVELSFFDPTQKAYVTRVSEPITIQVSAGTGGATQGSGSTQMPSSAIRKAPPAQNGPQLHPLRAEAGATPARVSSWSLVYVFAGAGFSTILGAIAWDYLRKRGRLKGWQRQVREKRETKSWQKLRERAAAARSGDSWDEVLRSYELLAGAVFDLLDRKHAVGARSLSRSELRLALADKGMPETLWQKVSNLLEFTETVRFAASIGAVSESEARVGLDRWVSEAEEIERSIG